MAGFGSKLDVSRMLARIRLLRARWTGDGLRKLGDFAAAEVLKDSLQSFSRQADPTTGKPWAPSKRARESFARAKGRFESGKRKAAPKRMTTLQDTGRLKRSVDATYELRGSGRLFVTGGTKPLDYAAIHQFGGTSSMPPGPRAIPARPYVGLSQTRRDRITAYARKVLAEGQR